MQLLDFLVNVVDPGLLITPLPFAVFARRERYIRLVKL
jgi:hypothetical protein